MAMNKAKKNSSKILDIQIVTTDEKISKISDLAAKNYVLYFYPKDSTPGCTIEGNEFNRELNKFKKNKVAVLGVSRDSLKSHNNFCQKQGFKFPLISDADEVLCKYFDVIKEKNMYGKKVLGIERSTFIISDKGEVIKEWRKVKVEGHVSEVLDFINSL